MSDCKHERVIKVGAKHSDMFWCTFPDGTEHEGYGILSGISSGDYMEFDVCIDCCVITTTTPQELQECFEERRKPDDGTPKAKAFELLEMMREKQKQRGGWGPPPKLDGMTDDDFYLLGNTEDPGEFECYTQEDFDRIDELYEMYRGSE